MDAQYKHALAAASAGSILDKMAVSQAHLVAEFTCGVGRKGSIRRLFAFLGADIAARSKGAEYLSPATE